MKTLGRHLIAEFYGCTDGALNDVARMREHMLAAAAAVGATVVGEAFVAYEPHGVSGTLLISESHLSVHSWPEAGYVAVDIFTCGGLDPRPGFALLERALAATDSRMHEIVRGLAADVTGVVLPDDVTILATQPVEQTQDAAPFERAHHRLMQTTDELLAQGDAALRDGDLDIAVRILRRATTIDPDDADVRHALALTYEALGQIDAMKREFLQVRLLDAEQDRRLGIGSERDMQFIENVALRVLDGLGEPFRSRMAHIPLMLEKRPSLAMVRTGMDPRTLGLFEGASILDDEIETPARVVVFTHNLLAECEDRRTLAEQIEITILHEIGHYFGLEEHDMDDLGLA